jgi:hypothetical protein
VPPHREDAALNPDDPTFADPIGAHNRAREALLAASGAADNPADATLERFTNAMRYAADQPAPAGRTRAIVHVTAITATIRTSEYSTERQISKNHATPRSGNRRNAEWWPQLVEGEASARHR